MFTHTRLGRLRSGVLTVCSFIITGQHLNILEPLNPSLRYRSAARITRVGFGAHKLYRSCTHCGLFVCRKRLASYPCRAWWWFVIVVNCFKSPSAENIQNIWTIILTVSHLCEFCFHLYKTLWKEPVKLELPLSCYGLIPPHTALSESTVVKEFKDNLPAKSE